MKLFVIATLVAVAAAGRLENQERSYLPPDNNAVGSARSSFGSRGFGAPSFQGSFGAAGAGQPNRYSAGSFAGATSNKYLPPNQGAARSSFGSNGGFGSARGSFGSPSSHGAFGSNSGAFGATGRNAGSPFASATSNQYLPPNHGPSANNGAPRFAGSLQGFGAQNFRGQQYQAAPSQQYQAAPSQQYGAPQAGSSFGAPSYRSQFPQQSAAASRQYLAPSANSFRNTPQQSFDEQTGYQY